MRSSHWNPSASQSWRFFSGINVCIFCTLQTLGDDNEVRSSHKRVCDKHDCFERSIRGLFRHSLDEWLLSDLGQFNAVEAIPQGLQGGPHSLQNLRGCFSRQGRADCAPGMLRLSILPACLRSGSIAPPAGDACRGFLCVRVESHRLARCEMCKATKSCTTACHELS